MTTVTSVTTVALMNTMAAIPSALEGGARLRAWFADRGWKPFPFQEETWDAYARGESGLVHVPTGAGKTYAAYLPALAQLLDAPRRSGLAILYITPLRALARDIELALAAPVAALGDDFRVESRTGDTSGTLRARQRRKLPEVLVTTPESLSVLLSYEDAPTAFAGLRAVIVDEWHELISTKRGTQVELALSRLKRWVPAMQTWALSATLRDPREAAQCVVGSDAPFTLVSGNMPRDVVLSTLLPPRIERFPWAGRLGLAMLPQVLELLEDKRSTLLFTNTRSQVERWFRAIIEARPDWSERVALHHGSIDRDERARVEGGLKDGTITAVVATSSLDLGVDFSPVERVVQIGSPKGIARLLQRAGRSAHRPNEAAQVACVPTYALELVELAALRTAVEARNIEGRSPLSEPLDVLVQHLVTCAMGGGFSAGEMHNEIRRAWSYRHLTRATFDWALALVEHGGVTLRAYEQHHKIVDEGGVYRVSSPQIARFHRLGIGTITSDASVEVRFLRGGSIGTIEEGFITRLKPGQRFTFAGRSLEFVRSRDMVAWVRRAGSSSSLTPAWAGSRLPLSTSLGREVRLQLQNAALGLWNDAPMELRAARPVLDEQARLSRIPAADELLIERWRSRSGYHVYLYPFEGRRAHQALASLLAYRLGRRTPATFGLTVNDYGIELLTDYELPVQSLLDAETLTDEGVEDDLVESVNLSELAKRQFRDIARIAGLVFAGYPGKGKGARQVQLRTSLVYDVFKRYDPDNLLLAQARREVLEEQFEVARLLEMLRRLSAGKVHVVDIPHPTPLAFPLLIDRLGSRLSTEELIARVERMVTEWRG
ncbi:MAG: ligase-associated DNA damage response DEXH box helicase [Gemmatimonadaceae bacterium]